jgi:hypothetical protein
MARRPKKIDSREWNRTDRKLGLHDPVVKLDVPKALRGLLCPLLGLKLDKSLALERCVETGAPGAGDNEASDTPKVALALVHRILGNLFALLRRRASPQKIRMAHEQYNNDGKGKADTRGSRARVYRFCE